MHSSLNRSSEINISLISTFLEYIFRFRDVCRANATIEYRSNSIAIVGLQWRRIATNQLNFTIYRIILFVVYIYIYIFLFFYSGSALADVGRRARKQSTFVSSAYVRITCLIKKYFLLFVRRSVFLQQTQSSRNTRTRQIKIVFN